MVPLLVGGCSGPGGLLLHALLIECTPPPSAASDMSVPYTTFDLEATINQWPKLGYSQEGFCYGAEATSPVRPSEVNDCERHQDHTYERLDVPQIRTNV